MYFRYLQSKIWTWELLNSYKNHIENNFICLSIADPPISLDFKYLSRVSGSCVYVDHTGFLPSSLLLNCLVSCHHPILRDIRWNFSVRVIVLILSCWFCLVYNRVLSSESRSKYFFHSYLCNRIFLCLTFSNFKFIWDCMLIVFLKATLRLIITKQSIICGHK